MALVLFLICRILDTSVDGSIMASRMHVRFAKSLLRD